VRGQILGGDSIPTLTATFSRVMQVSTGANVSSASSMDLSAMYSGRGRGRGRRCHFGGGRGSFDAGRNVPGRRLNASDKGSRHCTHCGRNNHISEKCWTKFGRSEWAEPHAPCDTHQTPSIIFGSSGSSTVILSQTEYDRLCQIEFS